MEERRKGLTPLEYFKSVLIEYYKVYYIEHLFFVDPVKAHGVPQHIYQKHAEADWNELLEKINNANIPANFLNLLECKKKADQVKLLKGQELTALGYASFLIKAGNEHGYKISSYKTEIFPNGTNTKSLPRLFHIKKAGPNLRIGNSPLSDGQLKNIITQRRVLLAKILDRGNEWHCLFQLEKAIRGNESWRGGQPHCHYISDIWGISREDIVKRIKCGDLSTEVHIPLIDYGPQPNK